MSSHRRDHTVKQEPDCIETRLFRVGQTGSSTFTETSKDSNLRPTKEPKVFSNNGIKYLGPPPEQSMNRIDTKSSSKQINKITDYTYNLENWITVFCINPEKKGEIIKFFSKYGEISNAISPSNNYMSLEFVNKSDVDKIMNGNQNCSQPILINSNAVICERGKFGQKKYQKDETQNIHYHTLKERIRPEATFWEIIRDFFSFIKWNFY